LNQAPERLTVIEINKEYLKFSAAHFTIFNATERERLHGHNFLVCARASSPVGDNGLCFPYDRLKKKLRTLCDELDEYTLLPAQSPHMGVNKNGHYYIGEYNGEKLWFVAADTLLLPIRNSTVEELSYYLLQRLLEDDDFIQQHDIRAIEVKVSSGPGQCGNALWGQF
jgi:6-pyruvoyltetrahydropterin/6-carboxytetrahydropterin synthase